MDRTLDQLRLSIDDIDQTILRLLAERLRLVLDVGEYKRQRDMEVYDPDRERQLLERLCEAAPEPLTAGMARRIFETIVHESRSRETTHVSGAPPEQDP